MSETESVRVLQAGERVWLVLEERPLRIRFVIEYGPAVNQRTHETLMMYRVDHFTVKRYDRWPLGFYEELRKATDACARALGVPSLLTPERAPDGSVVTPAEQRQRWQAGLDPRTGLPRRG
ncbi:hypothetical protein [Microbacterium azadirachtae]|uniref:hypothetical protein n=1 Tax=Microbacterium azadirachtae TaxID=582680 RepID=UPI00088D3AFB|nr:hypothetical protein [Microbacterium azadirachtae]SDL92969.1 hypothetical protein SAMN04488593_2203 [Microbacterium azadirachtae]SEG14912.1 hypothetical protein SAMN04488594_1976 [Microbacterium azadirachtae]SEG17465.1 hypothetical protein SAMN04488592_1986 [Microbacterium azadirachtae]